MLSAVNYQTVCNDLYLGSVQTNNCFYRRHNTADVRQSQLVAPLLTANCNLVVFMAVSFRAEKKGLCCSFSFLMSKQQRFYVICYYILDFWLRCYQGDVVSGIGYFLLLDSTLLYYIRQNGSKKSVYILQNTKQANFNALINHILQNTYNLSHILCASRPSESSLPSLDVFFT